ncbi:hypothetical protein [Nostoc sp.]|uniref:hypothetical protein n=1 Tax=Nostoc sp. TaxID=1180 RepID=UPI002FFBE4B4
MTIRYLLDTNILLSACDPVSSTYVLALEAIARLLAQGDSIEVLKVIIDTIFNYNKSKNLSKYIRVCFQILATVERLTNRFGFSGQRKRSCKTIS